MDKQKRIAVKFDFDEIILLNLILKRPDKTTICETLEVQRENGFDLTKEVAERLLSKIQGMSDEEIRKMFPLFPLDPCTGISEHYPPEPEEGI